MQEQAKEPAPSQQPPPHTNRGSNKHEVGGGGGGGGPQPQVNTRLKDGSDPGETFSVTLFFYQQQPRSTLMAYSSDLKYFNAIFDIVSVL